jgi:hypothetical protein
MSADRVGPFTREAFERHQRFFARRAEEREKERVGPYDQEAHSYYENLVTDRKFKKLGYGNPWSWTPVVQSDVAVERARQDTKWGEQNRTPVEWMSILGEEYGEACQSANDLYFETADITVADLRAELVQVAAVAIAAIENIDRNGMK